MLEAGSWFLEVVDTLFVVADPAKRLYWLHLLTAAALASLYLRCSSQDWPFEKMFRGLFNPDYWWNSSTKLDYGLFCLNGFLKIAVFAPVLGGQVVVSLAVTKFLHFNVAEGYLYSWAPIWISIVFTLAAFVFDDFMRFVVHVCMHRIPFMWYFHRVHHSATTLTPFTVHRTHPVESFINSGRAGFSVGLMSGLFVWLFGPSLQVWDILGVNALGFVLTIAGANLRHSHIPLHFGSAERLFISPAQHQLHHSIAHAHPNFGSFMAVWDRYAGTWVAGDEAQGLSYGVKDRPRKLQIPAREHDQVSALH